MSCPNFCTQKKLPRAEMASPFFKGRATTKYPKSAVFLLFSENVLIEFFKTKSSVFKQKYQHFHFGMVVFFNVER